MNRIGIDVVIGGGVSVIPGGWVVCEESFR
jgi:hypothetical protein